MVQTTEQKKRQKILVIILIIVAVAAVLTWYFSSQKEPLSEDEGTASGVSLNEQKLKTIKLDFGVLDDVLFKSLKSYGVLPVTAGETGQPNPFQP